MSNQHVHRLIISLDKGSLGVNFIHVLHMNFSHKCHFGSFFYIHVTREKLPKQCLYKIFVRKMLMKLTLGCIVSNKIRLSNKRSRVTRELSTTSNSPQRPAFRSPDFSFYIINKKTNKKTKFGVPSVSRNFDTKNIVLKTFILQI